MAEDKPVFINDVLTPRGRVAFPHLTAPDSKGRFADDKYKVTLCIPKTTDITALKKAVLECAREKWPKANFKLTDLMHPFRDGDAKNKKQTQMGKTPLDGYDGALTITCKTRKEPNIVGLKAKGDTSFPKLEGSEIYAGCDARLILTAMSYELSGKPGVTFLLETVQKLGDNDRFGGGGGGDQSLLDDDEGTLSDDAPLSEESDVGSDDDMFGGNNEAADDASFLD